MVIQINNTISPAATPTQDASRTIAADRETTVSPAVESQPETVQVDTQAVNRELEEAVSNINDFVQSVQRNIQFSVSENSGRTIIEVYDRATEELIREIPSEEVQRISEAIAEQLSEGLLVRTNI